MLYQGPWTFPFVLDIAVAFASREKAVSFRLQDNVSLFLVVFEAAFLFVPLRLRAGVSLRARSLRFVSSTRVNTDRRKYVSSRCFVWNTKYRVLY